jgi:iodotyrosine deiodinase
MGGAMSEARFVPLDAYWEYPVDEMIRRAANLRIEMQRRRTVRSFSSRPVPREIIEDCLLVAGSAPSGANLQPWQFVVVGDPAVKRRIREVAEREEHEFYGRRGSEEWLDALVPLGTGECKPFLETAPYLIAIFAQTHRYLPDGGKVSNYYVSESVGIAIGMLITAIHHAGLASLTYTPNPMSFLRALLGRPRTERPYLLLVVGYPADDALIPEIGKKCLDEIATFLE